jgi:lysylphosphatidylglycerol synthetase-like protein (DUF2156 family)
MEGKTMEKPLIAGYMETQTLDLVAQRLSREAIVDCVRRFGGSCTDAILDETTVIYTTPTVDGLIGYRLENSCAVVYGDPVCSLADRETLVAHFHRYCVEQGLSIVYIATTGSFARWAHPRYCGGLIQFGAEVTLNPHDNPQAQTGTRASLVRRKVRHAIKEGAVIRELRASDPELEAQLEQVRREWLQARQGLQIHISNTPLFTDRLGKRWFYTQQGDRVTGVVVLSQLQSRNGWLLNHLMQTSDAVGGTPEILVCTALDTVAQENCDYVTFGTVTTPELGEIIGLSKISTWASRHIYRRAVQLFQLANRQKFWEKFHPQAEPLYLLFNRRTIRLRELYALTRALNIGFSSKSQRS